MRSNLELKEKVLNYVKDKRWDFLLVHAFLAIQHYSSWSKRDDFEDELNLGLKNLSFSEKLLVSGRREENVNFVNAIVNNVNFSIGGLIDHTSMPDGSSYTVLNCSLLIENKVVLTIQYSEKDYESYDASHHTMISVEELHVDSKIDCVLSNIEALIKEHKKLQNRKRLTQENEQYDGKFSFGDETSNKKRPIFY